MRRIEKLIACDLDGTLLDDHALIPPQAVEGVRAALRPGVEFTFSSGRGEESMKPFVAQMGIIHVPMITETGALLQDPDDWHIIAEWSLSAKVVSRVLELLEGSPYDFNFYLSRSGRLVVFKNAAAPFFLAETPFGIYDPLFQEIHAWHGQTFDGFHKIAIRCHPEETDAFEDLLERGLDATATVKKSAGNCIDIMGTGVTKGSALLTLVHMLQVDVCNVMAIGDNETDASMFSVAGVSVTTANGDASARRAARYVVPSNEACGVVTAVERFVAGEYHA